MEKWKNLNFDGRSIPNAILDKIFDPKITNLFIDSKLNSKYSESDLNHYNTALIMRNEYKEIKLNL